MYKPNFKYTDKIVNSLTTIAEYKAIIFNAPLIPKWEITLRKEAILNNAHASTSIEGNPLSFDDVSALAEGRQIMAKRKDEQEVLNYLSTLNKIPEFSKQSLELDDLLEIHFDLTKDTLSNNADEGILRNRQVYVGRRDGSVVFMPPQTEEVHRLVIDFLNWFNSSKLHKMNPVIIAGLTHYELVRIHPFIDGNGRLARVMATLALYKFGFDLKRFFALDDYYDSNRQEYYKALQEVDPNTIDLTKWLEYFTKGVEISLEKVKDKVIGLSKDIKFLKEKGQIALNERQMEIVERILANGKITNREIRDMFNVSESAARKETAKLLGLEIIKKEGSGRNLHYTLS